MVAISIKSGAKQIDLVKEGYDLAIRLGTLRDSSMMSKRAIVASPTYLAARAKPVTIENLAECDFISVAVLQDEITLSKKGQQVVIIPQSTRVEVDTAMTAKSAVIASLGLRALPLSDVEPEIQSGELVHVLPDWQPPSTSIYAVWPDLGPQKNLTRRLIEFLASKLRV